MELLDLKAEEFFAIDPISRRVPRTFDHSVMRCPFRALVGRSAEVRLCSKADVNLATVIDHHGPIGDIALLAPRGLLVPPL